MLTLRMPSTTSDHMQELGGFPGATAGWHHQWHPRALHRHPRTGACGQRCRPQRQDPVPDQKGAQEVQARQRPVL